MKKQHNNNSIYPLRIQTGVINGCAVIEVIYNKEQHERFNAIATGKPDPYFESSSVDNSHFDYSDGIPF